MSESNNRIKIAVQKSGRLSDDSFSLLERCGIKIKKSNGRLFCHSQNFPLDVLLVRDDDILSLIQDGICELGIVGTNILREKALQNNSNVVINPIEEVINLNFGFCKLSIAVPDTFSYVNISSLANKRIATTYPNLLKQFLKNNNVDAKVVVLTGAVEIAPRLNIADAICDLVSTGVTLEANGLCEVENILSSQAVLVKSLNMSVEKESIFKLLRCRIESVLQANEAKYIMLHCPKIALDKIVKLLPGAENPTVMNLTGSDVVVAVHAVCKESVFWETLEQLKAAGASAILVLPIEKMMG